MSFFGIFDLSLFGIFWVVTLWNVLICPYMESFICPYMESFIVFIKNFGPSGLCAPALQTTVDHS